MADFFLNELLQSISTVWYYLSEYFFHHCEFANPLTAVIQNIQLINAQNQTDQSTGVRLNIITAEKSLELFIMLQR